nr:MAG TPA: hypothetical protein [Caudoviricetes sp.]
MTQFQIQPRFGGAFLLPCIDTVQGFCFARRRISQAQAFTAAFLPSMQNYTAKTSKPFTRLYSGISVDLPYSSTHNTATAQAAYTPTAPRWRAYRQAQHLHRYQIQPPRWTLHSLTQPPYYNNVYKSAPPVMDTC